jgi:hypothetical protein
VRAQEEKQGREERVSQRERGKEKSGSVVASRSISRGSRRLGGGEQEVARHRPGSLHAAALPHGERRKGIFAQRPLALEGFLEFQKQNKFCIV